MKTIHLLTFLTLIFTNCYAGKKPSLNQQDFTFIMEFHPSFIPSCRITLQKKGNENSISLDKIYVVKRMLHGKRKDLIIENKNNLLIDPGYLRFCSDTIYLEHIETVNVNQKNLDNFLKDLSSINLLTQKSLIKENILDGITVYFQLMNESQNNRFSFRCPDKSDKSEFQIIKSLFNIYESCFKTTLANNYIEDLKGYFDFGLLVKHISDKPLEYRFYGSLSSNEADELYAFIKRLPKKKPVIFDFSNFGGMGTMFYEDFEELIEENPNVYWLVSDRSIRQIEEIGVKKEMIFKNKEELMKRLKNVP